MSIMMTAIGLAVALRLLPDAADLVFECGAIEQRRQAIVRRDFGELAMLEERRAIRVLQRIRAGKADDVGAEQREHQVGGGGRGHGAER